MLVNELTLQLVDAWLLGIFRSLPSMAILSATTKTTKPTHCFVMRSDIDL